MMTNIKEPEVLDPRIFQLVEECRTDPHKITEALALLAKDSERIYKDYATYKAMYENLDRQAKPFLASITMAQEGKSQTAKEAAALGSEAYISFIAGLNEAHGEYLQRLASYQTLQTVLACVQSINKFATTEASFNR